MRIAVVSDIHSNEDALEAVIREIDRQRADRVLHLGDLVGYNAEPERCVQWAREHTVAGVMGNHDAVVTGKTSGEFFHTPALLAARWSAEHISPESAAYLSALPESHRFSEEILLAHGAPSDPDRYLFLLEDAEEEVDMLSGVSTPRVVFFGHTHIPVAYVRKKDGTTVSAPLEALRIEEGETAMLNPGSVGQPRDGDPRASYALFDTEPMSWEFRRVPYPVEITQERMRARGLPQRLIDRLQMGR